MNNTTDPIDPPLFTQPLAGDYMFHGHSGTLAMARCAVTIETPNGDSMCALPHHRMHSPDGYNWGYVGRGPTELARCILIAALGSGARCPECAGSTRTVWDKARGRYVPFESSLHRRKESGHCHECSGGIALTPEVVNDFTRDPVARWPRDRDWSLTVEEVRVWLAGHGYTSSATSV